jgi:hypothetical protein
MLFQKVLEYRRMLKSACDRVPVNSSTSLRPRLLTGWLEKQTGRSSAGMTVRAVSVVPIIIYVFLVVDSLVSLGYAEYQVPDVFCYQLSS